MTDIDSIRQAAEAQGYELAHARESIGKDARAIVILVKLSNRKIGQEDSDNLYRAGKELERGLDTVSATLDPTAEAQRERCRREIADIYEAAGVTAIYMESLPNGYCSEPCCLNKPWFRVTSEIGHVVIGWRKNVISIDWKDAHWKRWEESLFPYEKVTQSETGIHAWGADKAAEYIRRLHGAK